MNVSPTKVVTGIVSDFLFNILWTVGVGGEGFQYPHLNTHNPSSNTSNQRLRSRLRTVVVVETRKRRLRVERKNEEQR